MTIPVTPQIPEQPFVSLSEESTKRGIRFPTEEERTALLEKLAKLADDPDCPDEGSCAKD